MSSRRSPTTLSLPSPSPASVCRTRSVSPSFEWVPVEDHLFDTDKAEQLLEPTKKSEFLPCEPFQPIPRPLFMSSQRSPTIPSLPIPSPASVCRTRSISSSFDWVPVEDHLYDTDKAEQPLEPTKKSEFLPREPFRLKSPETTIRNRLTAAKSGHSQHFRQFPPRIVYPPTPPLQPIGTPFPSLTPPPGCWDSSSSLPCKSDSASPFLHKRHLLPSNAKPGADEKEKRMKTKEKVKKKRRRKKKDNVRMEKDELCIAKIRAHKAKHCVHAGSSSKATYIGKQSAAMCRKTYRNYNLNSSDADASEDIHTDTDINFDSDNSDEIQYVMESMTVHHISIGQFESLTHLF